MTRWIPRAAAALLVLAALPARAQPAPDAGAATTPSDAGAAVTPPGPVAPPPAPPPPAPPTVPAPPAPPTPPPTGTDVLVVVWPSGGVPEAALAAVREALVAALASRVAPRAVRVLDDGGALTELGACPDDTCAGLVARAHGGELLVSAQVARGTGSRRGQLAVTLQLLGTGQEQPEGTPVMLAGSVDATRAAEQLAPAIEPVAGAIPPPPPPPPPPPTNGVALIGVSADGARVHLDGRDVGESPIEPIELEPGEHRIEVTLAGHVRYRARFTVVAGETARVDVALRRDPAVLRAEAAARADAEDAARPWYLRWYTIGGAAAAVTAITVVVIVAAASSGEPAGVPVPGLRK